MKGIYGIYSCDNNGNQELLYVGYTLVSFWNRFNDCGNMSHQSRVVQKSSLCLYSEIIARLEAGFDVYMQPILTLEEMTFSKHTVLSARDVQCMEAALIAFLHPKVNISGNITNYSFDNKKNEIFICSYYEQNYKKPVRDLGQWRFYFTLDGAIDERNIYEPNFYEFV